MTARLEMMAKGGNWESLRSRSGELGKNWAGEIGKKEKKKKKKRMKISSDADRVKSRFAQLHILRIMYNSVCSYTL